MPLVPREKIDDVRDRTNIVDIVKRHVELKRAGTGSWKGLCPFHSEKTPSFNVNEARQFFHCFGCGEKGDVFGFLVKIEQRPFMEVLTDLAGSAGIDLEVRPLTEAERRARKARSCSGRMVAAAPAAAVCSRRPSSFSSARRATSCARNAKTSRTPAVGAMVPKRSRTLNLPVAGAAVPR
ncbi:MAG TPA: CHC2 zinc finger domain-containing protein, partial [Trebonia sp.]|nr:CHC2 zinc finger domain-containing protein [Trebonia sp.]